MTRYPETTLVNSVLSRFALQERQRLSVRMILAQLQIDQAMLKLQYRNAKRAIQEWLDRMVREKQAEQAALDKAMEDSESDSSEVGSCCHTCASGFIARAAFIWSVLNGLVVPVLAG